jgi:geranylgeranylglycerol-phosphate geranylgeranyltransferase
LPFSAGVCVILGELLAAQAVPRAADLVLGFCSIFFISATALILNDYFDYEVDKVNAPERPLPAGLVTKRDVVILSVVVALLGMACSALISGTALAVTVVVWILGVAYNWRLKRTGLPGNLVVAVSVGMIFIFGGIVVGHPRDLVVWWFGALAMLIDLGEEIAADAMDVEGDRLGGSRSLAVVFGPRAALRASAGIFFTVVVLSVLPFPLRWLDPVYLVPMALMDVAILYPTIRLLGTRPDRPRRFIQWIYRGALGALLVFIVMRLVVR